MNNYIVLDSFRYMTQAASWEDPPVNPRTFRTTLSGNPDGTYGPTAVRIWMGEIIVKVTPDGVEWGDVDDIKATLDKQQNLTLVDHYGASFTVMVKVGGKRSLSPKWDSPSNEIYYEVEIMGISDA